MLITWEKVTREQFEHLVLTADRLCAAVETGGGTFPFEMAYRLRQAITPPEKPTSIRAKTTGEAMPDYDPRIDHPERYREGPI